MKQHRVIRQLAFSAMLCAVTGANAAIRITIDTASAGRTFEGLGAASAGASSRLLIDYPEPFRSDILDYLFKPYFGAGFQHLKVEIGGDVNSTCGTEPSFAHTRAEMSNPDFRRGYEYWLMKEAKNRNPAIFLDALEWGAPGWFTGGFFSADNAQYMVKFLQGAQSAWGLTLDYIGGAQNEVHYDRNWLVNTLRPALDAAGFTNVKIVAPEGVGSYWALGSAMITDAALRNAVYAMGYHYVGRYNTYGGDHPPDAASLATGKPLWASEEWSFMGDGWDKALSLVLIVNYSYVAGKMTKVEIWDPIDAYYDNVTWSGVGPMVAHSPWSGSYSLRPALWGAAHVTQFAQPGWRFLDPCCGKLSGDGYYVTLCAPGRGDYSMIVASRTSTDTIIATLAANVAQGPVHVWRSTLSAQFIQQADITPAAGTFSVIVPPGSIYSLTTTTGQTKGAAAHAVPPAVSFPLPYTDDFDNDSIGQAPRYTQDQSASFEAALRTVGTGRALRQVVPSIGIPWDYHCNADPFTEIGDQQWTDIEVQSDVYIENAGYAAVYGRVFDAGVCPPKSYSLRLYGTGQWAVKNCTTTVASGTVSPALGSWHTLKLRCQGSTLTAYIDNVQEGTCTDATFGTGMAGLGTGWNTAQFDNLSIASIDSLCPVLQSTMTAAATSQEPGFEAGMAVDGNTGTMWHTAWTVPAALPQSITLNLGADYTVSKLVYTPRQDGNPNGNITAYAILTSTDGLTFTQRAMGTWADDATLKTVRWSSIPARYIRLTATAGHAGFASAAELYVYCTCLTGTIVPSPHSSIAAGERIQDICRAGFGSFAVPAGSAGKSFEVSLYDLCGKCLKRIVVNKRNIDLQRDLKMPENVVLLVFKPLH